MCTLTFTGPALDPLASPADLTAGYTVLFNRDELRSRGPELPPREELTPSGVRYLSPVDSDAGGTWITANERGVTVALLNGYIISRGPDREAWTSRGALVRSLADLARAGDLAERVSAASLAQYRPSVLVAMGLGEHPVLARWDGLELTVDRRADLLLPITSSSFEQDAVQRFRAELYAKEVGDAPPRPEALDAFHAWTEPAGPTATSPSMARPDAATRSHCRIAVSPAAVRFDYTDAAPHAGRAARTFTLAVQA